MPASKSGTQSAAERRSAEAELRGLVEKFSSTQAQLVRSVRRKLRARLPSAHEIVYEYRDCFVIAFSPDERGYEGVLAIRGSADGIDLYFNRGKELSDPEKLLKGSAKLVRFVRVESAAMLARPAVARLIEEAIAHARAPFASGGRGPIAVRSTTAKKRRK